MTERETRHDERQSDELTEQQLDQITAGTKTTDASSPTLYKFCCTGKHINSGNMH
ncbi:MAG TPA: type VI secretion system tube protein Hcp [Rhizobiaceae bacterium]|nr:type VI secretion system tube protein Hcp [Rhizobiaceae bacterium]